MTILAFLISGALAGLAGITEVADTMGQLQPSISPGYGFTAIIFALLARRNPVAILSAGVVLALSYLGGEGAQIALLQLITITRAIQRMLLFFALACDAPLLH